MELYLSGKHPLQKPQKVAQLVISSAANWIQILSAMHIFHPSQSPNSRDVISRLLHGSKWGGPWDENEFFSSVILK